MTETTPSPGPRPQRVAILTSGGDAPGMNACVRAAVRIFLDEGVEPFGVEDGYLGLVENRMRPLTRADVDLSICRGGTLLGTARCNEFRDPLGRRRAAENLRTRAIDSLLVVGGDGSMRGAVALMSEHGFPVWGVPGTIDNDVVGTDETIGFDTAIYRGVEAIDRIRDTAESHHRIIIVEVMGRHSSAIAVAVGIAGGVEAIVAPDWETDVDKLVVHLEAEQQRHKSSVVVVAEGDETANAEQLRKILDERIASAEVRASILGHVQRGGAPSPRDRILGTRLGIDAARGLVEGHTAFMSGMSKGDVRRVPMSEVASGNAEPALCLAPIAQALALVM